MVVNKKIISLIFIFSAVTTGLSLLPKVHLIGKIINLSIFTPAVYGLFLLLMFASILYPYILHARRVISVVALLGMAVTALIVQPRVAQLHSIGRGTDQGDCLIVGVHRLLNFQWPYDAAEMWSHNPMSCGPGWLLLHLPFLTFLSYPATMLALLLGSIGIVARCAGLDKALRFVTLISLVPGTWLSLANGNDFVSFGFCIVALAVMISLAPRRGLLLLAPLALLLSQFRLPFLLLPFPAYLGARASSRLLSVGTSALSVLVWSAFFWFNPVSFIADGPMHVVSKFSGMIGSSFEIFPFAAAGLIGLAIFFYLMTRIRFPDNIVVYLACALLPLAALDLHLRLKIYGTLRVALEHWEGTSWTTAIAVFAAWLIANSENSTGAEPKPVESNPLMPSASGSPTNLVK